MKQPKKPTRANKVLMEAYGLNCDSWMVVWEDKDVLEIISKRSHLRRVLKKGGM